MEFALTAFEVFGMQYLCSCAIGFHRPLLALFPVHPTSHLRRVRSDLLLPVPARMVIGLREAHMGHYLTDDLSVGLGAGQGFYCIHPLDATFSIGKGPLFPGRISGKTSIGMLESFRYGRSPGSTNRSRGCRAPSSPAGCSGQFVPHLRPSTTKPGSGCRSALHPTSPEFSIPYLSARATMYSSYFLFISPGRGAHISCSLVRLTSHIGCSPARCSVEAGSHTPATNIPGDHGQVGDERQ